jgi:LmbE family N-acetylglucosaminyl deacetylase
MPFNLKTAPFLQGIGSQPDIDLTAYKRACVLVPHPDDEAIGCGGLMAALAQTDCLVGTLLITDGSGGTDAPFNASEIRMTEFTRSVQLLGAKELGRLMLKDSKLSADTVTLHQLTRAAIMAFRPDVIIAPWAGELHPDHAALGRCAADIAQELSLTLIAYEVWSPLQPTHVLDISAFAATKHLAIEQHATALRYGNYLHAAMGLAQYRSLLLPFQGETELFAESFLVRNGEVRQNSA